MVTQSTLLTRILYRLRVIYGQLIGDSYVTLVCRLQMEKRVSSSSDMFTSKTLFLFICFFIRFLA